MTDSSISSLAKNVSQPLLKEYVEKVKRARLDRDHLPLTLFSHIGDTLPYEHNTNISKHSPHIGQLKLHLAEVMFLTRVRELISSLVGLVTFDSPTIFYAGAAPGNHTFYLSTMFPEFKFILSDPNPFKIIGAKNVEKFVYNSEEEKEKKKVAGKTIAETCKSSSSKLITISGYVDLTLVKAFQKVYGKRSLFFISDIRTNTVEGTGASFPDTIDITFNNAQVFNWLVSLDPILSMVKMRHPFYNDVGSFFDHAKEEPYASQFRLAKKNGIDFIKCVIRRELKFFDGEMCLQCYPGQSSTECRLITDCSRITSLGTVANYEDGYFFYNSVIRPHQLFINDNADQKLGFDKCNDCSLASKILTEYFSTKDLPRGEGQVCVCVEKKVGDIVRDVLKINNRSLFAEGHGKMF